MECARGQSFTQWRLLVLRQLLLATWQPRSACRSVSTASAHEQPTLEDDGNSTAESNETHIPPSQRLPLSPLFKQSRFGRTKIRKKPPTPDNLSEASVALLKNPWAQALASPPRMCLITSARIPRALMGEWGLVRRPDTEQHYVLPVDLLQDSLQKHPRQGSIESAAITDLDQTMGVDVRDQSDEYPQNSVETTTVRRENRRRHLIFRTVQSRQYLQILSRPLNRNTGKKPAVSKLMPFRWRAPQGPMSTTDEQQLVWIPTMKNYVLRHMRQDIVKQLQTLSSTYKFLTAKHSVWRPLYLTEYSDAGLAAVLERMKPIDRMECGAVLLLGPLEERRFEERIVSQEVTMKDRQNLIESNATTEHPVATDEGTKSGGVPATGDFAKTKETAAIEGQQDTRPFSDTVILPHNQRRVPVFDLTVLLSKSDLKKLRALPGPHFEKPALFFRPHNKATIAAMLSLWKLKRYLAEDTALMRFASSDGRRAMERKLYSGTS